MSWDEYFAELFDGFRGCLVFFLGPLGPILRRLRRRRAAKRSGR